MLGQKSKRQIRKEEKKRQKEQEQKQKTVRGVSLLVMFFLFLMAIAFFPSFTSILFVLIGVAELQVILVFLRMIQSGTRAAVFTIRDRLFLAMFKVMKI